MGFFDSVVQSTIKTYNKQVDKMNTAQEYAQRKSDASLKTQYKSNSDPIARVAAQVELQKRGYKKSDLDN